MLSLLIQAAEQAGGGEANLILPDLSTQTFLGMTGSQLLSIGLLVCLGGLIFGGLVYRHLANLAVHKSMRGVSELIYATCKTYLAGQARFLAILEGFIALVIIGYFGFLRHMEGVQVVAILIASVIGILGSVGVAWFGMRVNTLANSRTAFAALKGKPYPAYAIPLLAGMSIGTMLISVELIIMLVILLYVPGNFAGPVF